MKAGTSWELFLINPLQVNWQRECNMNLLSNYGQWGQNSSFRNCCVGSRREEWNAHFRQDDSSPVQASHQGWPGGLGHAICPLRASVSPSYEGYNKSFHDCGVQK